jgi:hypothetical protein
MRCKEKDYLSSAMSAAFFKSATACPSYDARTYCKRAQARGADNSRMDSSIGISIRIWFDCAEEHDSHAM